MAKWQVTGYHRESGKRLGFTIEAASEEDARDECYRRECVIEKLERVDSEDATDGPDRPRKYLNWKANGWPIRDDAARAVYIVEQPRMTIHNFFATALAVGLGIGCVAPILGLILAVFGLTGLLSGILSGGR